MVRNVKVMDHNSWRIWFADNEGFAGPIFKGLLNQWCRVLLRSILGCPETTKMAMPPDIPNSNDVDGIWVSSLACTLPVATALRASLLQLASRRRNAEGQQTKSELVYAYLTGPQ